MRTLYMTDSSWHVYHDKDQCAAAEEREKAQRAEWKGRFDPQTKLARLKAELDEAMHIAPGTIATCATTSLQIKAMVRVCQRFADENKEYLNYY